MLGSANIQRCWKSLFMNKRFFSLKIVPLSTVIIGAGEGPEGCVLCVCTLKLYCRVGPSSLFWVRSHDCVRWHSLWVIELQLQPSSAQPQSLCFWPYAALLPICQENVLSSSICVCGIGLHRACSTAFSPSVVILYGLNLIRQEKSRVWKRAENISSSFSIWQYLNR